MQLASRLHAGTSSSYALALARKHAVDADQTCSNPQLACPPQQGRGPDFPRRRPRQRAHAVRQAGRPGRGAGGRGARAQPQRGRGGWHSSGSAKADRGPGLAGIASVPARLPPGRKARHARPSTGRPYVRSAALTDDQPGGPACLLVEPWR